MRSYQQLFAELKRRKVFKVAGVYGVVAFVLLQVADLLGQGLRLPESFMPFITAVILLGFPLALILAWAFEVTPDGVQRTAGAGPGEIERIVAEPAAKRWPAGLLALVGAVALLGGAWWAGTRMGPGDGAGTAAADETRPDSLQLAFVEPEADGRPSIAVLPFADMSPEGDQAYFSDGITEEILNTLAKIRELKVAARTSAFAFKGQNPDLRAVGDSLGVQYVIEGSVRKSGDALRITAQLIDAADGTHMWSESYDRTMTDVFAIQTEIAEAIAGELRVPLGLDDPAKLVTPTADLEAYDLYLAGRARLRERGQSLPEAIRLFEAAIARDSAWAPAWAGLAEAREIIGWYPEAWEAGEPRTREEQVARFDALQEPAAAAARRALALDPNSAAAHVALGSVLRNRMQWELSEAEYARAFKLDPEYPEAHLQYAQLLMHVGRLNEAIRMLERAIELDPIPISRRVLAFARLMGGQYEEALRELDRADPERTGRGNLEIWVDAHARLALGRHEEILGLEAVSAETARSSERLDQALRAIRQRDLASVPDEFRSPVVLMSFGRADEAARRLLDDFRVDPRFNAGIHWMPLFDPIRDHPAYLEMLRLANLDGVTSDRPAALAPAEGTAP